MEYDEMTEEEIQATIVREEYEYEDLKDRLHDLQQRIDKATEHLEESIDILKGDSMIPIFSGNVRRRYLQPVLEILKGSDKE